MNFEIVSSLPGSSSIKAETAYLVQRGSSTVFDLWISDRNKKAVKLTSYVDAPTDSKRYVRMNGNWTTFETSDFAFNQATKLTTQDLNTITTPGVYYQSEHANATKSRNYPTNNIRGGTLLVHPVIDNHGVHQVYFSGGTHGTDNTNAHFYLENPRIFIRKRISGGSQWSQWYEMSSTQRVLFQTANTFSSDDQIEEFDQNNATVVLPGAATTITLNTGRKTIKYVSSSNHNITFTKGTGVTLVGDPTLPGKDGKEITVIIAGTKAYINTPVQPEDTGSKLVGTWT